MKTLNYILTLIICLSLLVIFTPFLFAIGMGKIEHLSVLAVIGIATSTLSGTLFSVHIASKFHDWFNSHIK